MKKLWLGVTLLLGCAAPDTGPAPDTEPTPDPIEDPTLPEELDTEGDELTEIPGTDTEADLDQVPRLSPAELGACRTHVEVPDFPAGKRDIEFLAFGDTQFAIVDRAGCAASPKYRANQQQVMLDALNNITTQRWPAGFTRAGQPFRRIRGVLIAGDLGENGSMPRPSAAPGVQCPEFDRFEAMYGLCGERALRYPVYEGYGNHDFPFLAEGSSDLHPTVDAVDARNPYRPRVTRRASAGRGHYAWMWDDIHFVNLNVKASGTPTTPYLEEIVKSYGTRRVDPHRALSFLNNYLGSTVVPNGAQVMLMTHYGPHLGSRFTLAERTELCQVLDKHKRAKGVRVIGWINGHTHDTDYYRWTCEAPYGDITIPVFTVGSPFHAKDTNEGRIHFAAFRIGEHVLEAVDVSVAAAAPTVYEIPGHATFVEPRRFNADGQLGNWRVRLENVAPSGR